jgi:hypothetical protein
MFYTDTEGRYCYEADKKRSWGSHSDILDWWCIPEAVSDKKGSALQVPKGFSWMSANGG